MTTNLNFAEGEHVILNGIRHIVRNGKLDSNIKLSDPDMREHMETLKERLRTDLDFRREFLVSTGVWDENGRLTKKFRGVFDDTNQPT